MPNIGRQVIVVDMNDDINTEPVDEVFDAPSRWRARIVDDLGLTGDARCAGVSTSAAMPAVLEPALAAIRRAPDGIVLDLGGGLGSTAAWLQTSSGRACIVVEPSFTSCRMVGETFASLTAVCGDSAAVPVADAGSAVCVLNGVVSLVEDLDELVDEAARVLCNQGSSRSPTRWPHPTVTSTDRARTSFVPSMSSADTTSDRVSTSSQRTMCDRGPGTWGEIQEIVDDEIERRHRRDPGFATWMRDHTRMRDLVARDVITSGYVVAVRDSR